ncbi:MAG: nitroreductase family protein [Candidatus Latescibacter sp.]|nr:nitroreductase family protein [Candidatus Latescibacter sp.]
MKAVRAVFLSLVLVSFVFSAFPLTVFSQEKTKIPDALTVIHSRKSVRKYLDKPVTKDQLEILLRAGMASPTAADKRPWAFVVVTGRAMLDTLSFSTRGTRVLAGAKAAIVVCGDTRKGLKSEVWIQDCSAASENILLAAEAIGLGAVWTGIWLNVEPTKYVKRVLGLPAEVQPLNIISIGYPTGEEKPKDKWDPTNIHYEKW